jgi:hypothetical protein
MESFPEYEIACELDGPLDLSCFYEFPIRVQQNARIIYGKTLEKSQKKSTSRKYIDCKQGLLEIGLSKVFDLPYYCRD